MPCPALQIAARADAAISMRMTHSRPSKKTLIAPEKRRHHSGAETGGTFPAVSPPSNFPWCRLQRKSIANSGTDTEITYGAKGPARTHPAARSWKYSGLTEMAPLVQFKPIWQK